MADPVARLILDPGDGSPLTGISAGDYGVSLANSPAFTGPLLAPGSPIGNALIKKAAIGHTAVLDADYQGLATDAQIGMTSLTAPRTIYLPDVDAYPLGQVLFVGDESGACSEAIPITIAIAPGSGDTIAGQTSHTLTSAYQGRGLRRGAANLWIFA